MDDQLRRPLTDYARGFLAGVRETLDQVEARSREAPEGCYRGPLPDELRTWLARARNRVEAQNPPGLVEDFAQTLPPGLGTHYSIEDILP